MRYCLYAEDVAQHDVVVSSTVLADCVSPAPCSMFPPVCTLHSPSQSIQLFNKKASGPWDWREALALLIATDQTPAAVFLERIPNAIGDPSASMGDGWESLVSPGPP